LATCWTGGVELALKWAARAAWCEGLMEQGFDCQLASNVNGPAVEAVGVGLVGPLQFELPGFDALGEREMDTDIEEID